MLLRFRFPVTLRPQDCRTVVLNCFWAGTKLGLAMANDFEQTVDSVSDVAVRIVTSEMVAQTLTAKPYASVTPGYAWLA